MSKNISAIKNVSVSRQPLKVTFFDNGEAEIHNSAHQLVAQFDEKLGFKSGENKASAYEALLLAADKCTYVKKLKDRVSEASAAAGIAPALAV